MLIDTCARRFPCWVLAATAFGLTLVVAGCGDDNNGPNRNQTFNQVQRLGNPLVSEVLLQKRSHSTHGTTDPSDDATLVGPEIKGFVINTAGRSSAYADVLGSVLLPDVLVIQTDKDPATAGWLSWLPQLGNGYGGRKLTDDVVDLALLAVFGDPFGLDPGGAAGKEALTTDNVGSDSPFTTTFPYLALPN